MAIASNNSEAGNDPNITAETLRKQGALNEEDLPFTDEIKSWQEYMTPNPLPTYLTVKAKRWGYDFKHEWVDVKPESLWQALQFSSLGVSVMAWRKEGEFYVKEKGERDTHWTAIVTGKYKEYWVVDDSYLDNGERFKKLPWLYPFGYSKLYFIEKVKISRPFWCVYFPNWAKC